MTDPGLATDVQERLYAVEPAKPKRRAGCLIALASLALIAAPVAAQVETPPVGTLIVQLAISDGTTILPVAGGAIGGIVCWAAE